MSYLHSGESYLNRRNSPHFPVTFYPQSFPSPISYLRRPEPSVFRLALVHGRIEVIQEAIFEELVVNQIELASRVVITLLVAGAGEVEPLGVTELVA